MNGVVGSVISLTRVSRKSSSCLTRVSMGSCEGKENERGREKEREKIAYMADREGKENENESGGERRQHKERTETCRVIESAEKAYLC